MYYTYDMMMATNTQQRRLVSVYAGESTEFNSERWHVKDFVANSFEEVVEYYKKHGFNEDVKPEDITEDGDGETAYLSVGTAFLEGSTDPLSEEEIEEIKSHPEGSHHDHHENDIFWRTEYYEIRDEGEYTGKGMESMGHGEPTDFNAP